MSQIFDSIDRHFDKPFEQGSGFWDSFGHEIGLAINTCLAPLVREVAAAIEHSAEAQDRIASALEALAKK